MTLPYVWAILALFLSSHPSVSPLVPPFLSWRAAAHVSPQNTPLVLLPLPSPFICTGILCCSSPLCPSVSTYSFIQQALLSCISSPFYSLALVRASFRMDSSFMAMPYWKGGWVGGWFVWLGR